MPMGGTRWSMERRWVTCWGSDRLAWCHAGDCRSEWFRMGDFRMIARIGALADGSPARLREWRHAVICVWLRYL